MTWPLVSLRYSLFESRCRYWNERKPSFPRSQCRVYERLVRRAAVRLVGECEIGQIAVRLDLGLRRQFSSGSQRT